MLCLFFVFGSLEWHKKGVQDYRDYLSGRRMGLNIKPKDNLIKIPKVNINLLSSSLSLRYGREKSWSSGINKLKIMTFFEK